VTPPPHGLSRGNGERSRTRTDAPPRARWDAAADPAGPAPTTSTSVWVGRGLTLPILSGGLYRDAMALVDLLLRRPPHTPHRVAAPRLDEGVTIYWRDGCPYCLRLRVAVRRHAGRATWIDIRADPEAAAYVRTTNGGGFETVPTVVIDGVPHTNPAPGLVKDALVRR
jgi:mycoredoxin